MSMSVAGTVATMHLDFDSPEDFNGMKIEMTKNGNFKLTFNYRSGGIDGKVIVLDPGHGGADPGGGAGGVYEGPINAKIMELVGEKLTEAGAVVVNTNPDYKDVTLEERKMIARNVDANLFVSLHGNAATSTNASGAESYYFFPYSKQLASDMQAALVAALKQVYSPLEANYEKVDRGERYWGFSVCRLECCPSVLLEYEYLTNERAREIMQLPDTHEKIADAMAKAIINYFDYE